MFGWENRSNLTVPTMGTWFSFFPASPLSIASLGTLCWIAIAVLAATAVWNVTRDRLLSLGVGLLTLSDSRLIAEAISDARPDIPVLLVAMALLVALLAMLRRPASLPAFAAALVLAAALPLVHVTAANAIAALSAFLGLWAIAQWMRGRAPCPLPQRHLPLRW